MDRLRLKHQVVEGQVEQCGDLVAGPVGAAFIHLSTPARANILRACKNLEHQSFFLPT